MLLHGVWPAEVQARRAVDFAAQLETVRYFTCCGWMMAPWPAHGRDTLVISDYRANDYQTILCKE